MMLSTRQKQLLHSAARQAGLDDEQRKMVQWNVGGFHSAADKTASREGFIACMAFYESHCKGQLNGFTANYWRSEDAKANPTDALIYRCRQMAAALGWTPSDIDSFVAGRHCTNGAYAALDDLPAAWLRAVVEALKAITRRQSRTQRR